MVTVHHRQTTRHIPFAIVIAMLAAVISVQLLGAQSSMVENRSTSPAEPSSALFWKIDSDAVGTFQNDPTPELMAHIEQIMADMSDEERVAQLLMVSWAAEEPTPEVMRWIRERNIGGVKVFGWNGENLTTLAEAIDEMQQVSIATENGIPLFTATDQEGGWVRHVKDGTSVTPGNMAIGAGGLPYDALMTGRYIGLELRALGINMNFAPP